MSKQLEQQVVRIATNTAVPLSKQQKAFNRYTKRIAEQEKLIAELRAAIDKGRQRIQADLLPLRKQFDQLRADMVRLFDRMNTHHMFTKPERKKLTYLITDISYELIQKGHEDLTEIHDRYDEGGFEAAMAEAEEQDAASMRIMAEMMFGIQFDPAVDLSDPEKLREYIGEQLHQRAEVDAQRQQEAEAKRASKPKTEKQQAREAKKQAEALNVTKAVRALYMDLVKAFHPDREPDEAEKSRKTGIIQRVTEAYEKSDLMGLFRLQLEFERIDQAHLEKLADNQLLYYNKILKQQADELDAQLFQIQNELRAITGGGMFGFSTAVGLDYAINNDVKAIKADIKTLKSDLKSLTDPSIMKAWLKTFRIPKDTGSGPMGVF
ncbi:cell envelope integrity protein TolA [Fibrella aquatilis]|uniref:Cell envelope integrity protein TolA n=1 Tax=Fibrella aquatilis TaxID=2817059 RepID=A0A939G703_9BACT|nr:cell envelope integrity protein TolA [Fibrella aquatilis]MBO0931799.1 cell envelope integrity protein TolA [Fibrella aquatilis]